MASAVPGARNLGKTWSGANRFFRARQDGHIVALYRFVGDGKLPQRLALPLVKILIKIRRQAEVAVDRLREGLIRAIELALGCLVRDSRFLPPSGRSARTIRLRPR
jgi:hypothetical protein